MKRIVLTEGSRYPKTISALAEELAVARYDLVSSLYTADAYLSERLSIGGSLHIERDRLSFERIAGFFRVSEQLEIEIVPKFMNGSETWRSDFLLLLARTRWGVLEERQLVGASKSKERSISDSLAMVFLAMFDKIAHVPIRTYERRTLQRFEIEGDLDEESILLPDRDGFIQAITEFTRKNDYNAVIAAAARVLSQSISDFGLKSRLTRLICYFGPQKRLPSIIPSMVPSRFRSWSDLYELSVDILDGYGIDYINQGETASPGFVVRTSDAWEEFLRRALVAGMEECTVGFQEKHPFARRDNSVVKVRPDYTIKASDGRSLLVDAKYKYNDADKKTIANADIYEGWAFMEATGINRLVLLYPYAGNDTNAPFEYFQHVRNDTRELIGVRVNPALAGAKGINAFAKELARYISPMLVINQLHV